MKLWDAYVQNVDPLCKVLHVPTVAKLVETVSRQPATASKGDACLPAICHLLFRRFLHGRGRLFTRV
jgi:hypothetical protein